MNILQKSISAYWPLISLVLIAALASAALMHGEQKTLRDALHYFIDRDLDRRYRDGVHGDPHADFLTRLHFFRNVQAALH